MQALPRVVVPFALALAAGCTSFFDEMSGKHSSGAGPGGPGTETCSTGESGQAGLECRVLELVNERRAAGATCDAQAMPAVAPLEMHVTLRQTAREHAADMAQHGYFAHTGLDGRQPSDRISDAGYDWSASGENIAAGNSTAEETMDQWMNSDGHCRNIMDPGYIHIGVGYAFDESSEFGHYWVQNFGAPL